MIVTMRSTTSAQVATRLVKLRQEGGVVALGRVMTLVILPPDEEAAERAIRIANAVSQEHPARVVVVQPHLTSDDAPGIDAQIRVGGDAGASEVVVLRPYGPEAEAADTLVMPLLLSDAPIVAWWPGVPEETVAAHPVGRIATRRITDATLDADPPAALERLAAGYTAGDTDISWSGITLWRGVLAAALDEPPREEVTEVRVAGAPGHPSVRLLAAWLTDRLGCPARVLEDEDTPGISRVELDRPSGTLTVDRPGNGTIALFTRPGREPQEVNLARREVTYSLMEDLRRLDEDRVYGRTLRKGLPKILVG